MKKFNGTFKIILSGIVYILTACQAPYIDVKSVTTSPWVDQNSTTDQLYEQGKIAFKNKDMMRALRFFKAAHRKGPQTSRTLNGLGGVYDHLQRFDLAQTYYYRALELDPQSSAMLNNLGYSHLLQNKPLVAVDYFRKAYQLDSSDIYVQHNLMIAEQKVETRLAQLPAAKKLPHVAPVAQVPHVAQVTGDAIAVQLPEKPRQYAVVKLTSRLQKLTTQPPRISPELKPEKNIVGETETAYAAVVLTAASRPVGYQLSLKGQPEIYADYISGAAQIAQAKKAVADKVVQRDKAPQIPQRSQKAKAVVTPPRITLRDNIVFVSRPEVKKSVVRAVPVVEISNGAGRRGLAARLKKYIISRDIPVQRLTNADHFSHMTSRIYYQAGWEDAARELASQLPIPIQREEIQGQTADIRLEIGGDLLAYDVELIKHYRRKQ